MKLIKAILRFLAHCALAGIVGAVIGGLLFLPFGLGGWFFTGDVAVLIFASGFGSFIGLLLGIGQVFVDRFSDRPPDQGKEGESAGAALIDFYTGPLKPDWLAIFDVAKWFATKDFSAQKPGRWKRALVGAIGFSLCAGLMVYVATANASARSPDAPSPWEFALMLIVPAAVFGAVAGALTDSR